nr:hypothetical protein [uncultured Acetatifactor sp.]
MVNNENTKSINDNHNYDNHRSYNNLPLHQGECLVPIRVDWEMVKHFNMCRDNLETWHIGPNKVLVAFAPVAIEAKEASIKAFYRDVREYFASFHTDDALSLDQFLEEAASEDGKGFEPASTENLEETVLLRVIINDLIKQVHTINPKYGRILDLICEDYTKGQILEALHLGKSQGYADIKATQELAKKLYFGE